MDPKKKKQIAYTLLAIGIAGFIYAQNIKSAYRVFSERFTSSKPEAVEFKLLNNQNYLFSFWGNDEASTMGPYASLDVRVSITDSRGNVISQNNITATGTEDKGGFRRAANGEDIEYYSAHNQQIKIHYHIIQGDYLDIEIYEDLPPYAYFLPVLFIVVFLAGLVLYLKSRNVAVSEK